MKTAVGGWRRQYSVVSFIKASLCDHSHVPHDPCPVTLPFPSDIDAPNHCALVILPQTTEIERLVVQRIGQDIFRAALMDYWGARCPITGITDPALLRASHIVPWSECDDAERLDVHNGLLLSALWDAAFDTGLVSFTDDGTVLASPELSPAARTALGIERTPRLPNLRDPHRASLAAHRARHGFSIISSASVSIPISSRSR
jgi:hypothetical protein